MWAQEQGHQYLELVFIGSSWVIRLLGEEQRTQMELNDTNVPTAISINNKHSACRPSPKHNSLQLEQWSQVPKRDTGTDSSPLRIRHRVGHIHTLPSQLHRIL